MREMQEYQMVSDQKRTLVYEFREKGESYVIRRIQTKEKQSEERQRRSRSRDDRLLYRTSNSDYDHLQHTAGRTNLKGNTKMKAKRNKETRMLMLCIGPLVFTSIYYISVLGALA